MHLLRVANLHIKTSLRQGINYKMSCTIRYNITVKTSNANNWSRLSKHHKAFDRRKFAKLHGIDFRIRLFKSNGMHSSRGLRFADVSRFNGVATFADFERNEPILICFVPSIFRRAARKVIIRQNANTSHRCGRSICHLDIQSNSRFCFGATCNFTISARSKEQRKRTNQREQPNSSNRHTINFHDCPLELG